MSSPSPIENPAEALPVVPSSDDKASKKKKKNNNDPSVPQKPKRPFTAYNIYFQIERNYLIQSADPKLAPKLSPEEIDQDIESRPARYRDIVMPKKWYSVENHSYKTKNKSKKHRQNHGVMSFIELSKTIAKNWNECDNDTKMFCRDLAEKELERYQERVNAHVEKYGFESVRRTYKHRPKKDHAEIQETGKKVPDVEEDASHESNAHEIGDDESEEPEKRGDVNVPPSDFSPGADEMAWQGALKTPQVLNADHAAPAVSPHFFFHGVNGNVAQYQQQQFRSNFSLPTCFPAQVTGASRPLSSVEQQSIAKMQANQLHEEEMRYKYKSMALQREAKKKQYFAYNEAMELSRLRSKQGAIRVNMLGADQSEDMRFEKIVQAESTANSNVKQDFFIWGKQEDWMLAELHKMYGPQWEVISSLLPGRSEKEVKHRWGFITSGFYNSDVKKGSVPLPNKDESPSS